jgi:hypothetical protein
MACAYNDPRLAVPVGLAARHSMRDVIATAVWVVGWEQPEGNRWERIAELLDLTWDRLWGASPTTRRAGSRQQPSHLRGPGAPQADVGVQPR